MTMFKKGEKFKLSEHFNSSEFDCHCKLCKETKIEPELVSRLERLRELIGKPIIITSGYRCLAHNREVGSKDTSFHVKGMAADIIVKGMHPGEVANYIKKVGFGGVGIYAHKGFAHADIGPARRWHG